ncbi:hypothetical protein ACRRTK_017965 [Alexandromys fortis]
MSVFIKLCFSHGASYCDLKQCGIHLRCETGEISHKIVRRYWDCGTIHPMCSRKLTKHPPVKNI